ncbi:hypothetical protein LX32DRAFT_126284 [Colletotrichum zoysiae]|uniref:Transmembrane protein n=1 Tax=Colletotrichum zoysiae TaxID=1216348 RepID=A0AAD9H7W7_9PEZI|nr:hypothetical protein LX32DRAFT_126284 [Colletotrichum zoysiae]
MFGDVPPLPLRPTGSLHVQKRQRFGRFMSDSLVMIYCSRSKTAYAFWFLSLYLSLSFVFLSSLPPRLLLLRHDPHAHWRQDLYRVEPEQAKKKKRGGYLESGKEAAPCPLAGAGYAARLDYLSPHSFFKKKRRKNGANK